MKELIKIIFVFTFFTLSLSQFYKFYPEQGIYDVPERDEKECGKCPNYECDNITKICTDNETDCMEAKTYGQNCTEPCSGLPYHCVLCSRSGNECLECPNNETWGIHCNKSCKRCPGGKCLINDGKCSEDAPYCDDPTYHDEYCNTSCNITTPNCETCLKANGECTKCKHSYFTKNCNSQCEFCPDKDCDFDGICNDTESDCIDMKKRGEACNEDCNWDDSEHCVQCHRNGTCVFCEENKFWDPNCTKPCGDHCPDNSECEIDGFCSNEEDNCHHNLTYGNYCLTYCNDTRDNCITCNRKGICLTCLDNKTYGENCEYSCEKCPEGICDIDGVCLDPKGNCLNNLTFGPSCNESCSNINESCSTCNRNETCIECIDQTVFGEHCNKTCNCPGPKCEIDGTCVDYSGKCINDSFYGRKCDERCDKERQNCVLCDIFGICSLCSNETYFGENCTDICDHCPDRRCYMNGSCMNTNETCPDNHFYGPSCNIPCNKTNTNCDTCLRDGTCDNCKSLNYWGPKCDNTCEFCPGETCIINGTCTDNTSNCVNETRYGSECNTSCSEVNGDCKLCNRIGICLECVNNTIFGDTCNETCDNCPINGTDDYGYCFINGTCYNQIDSCTDEHYTGENCSVSCNSTHTYCDTCDRGGICIDCNNHTKFGQYCEDSCDNCPKNDTDEFGYCFINGTCYNKIDLCTDEHFTGENCSILCNSNHTYCDTCDREGICIDCTNITKFGPYCEDSCERCPNLTKFESLEDTSEDQALCFMNGTCKNQIDVCKDKMFTGESCNEKCINIKDKDNCLECDRKKICLKCKNESFFGINCTQECNNCPGNPGECYVSGDCKDPDTDCKNNIYTGNNCSVLCSEAINKNCYKCDRKGNCFDCINKTQFGNKCNISCSNCPGEKEEQRICYINGTCYNQIDKCFDDTKFGKECNTSCSDYPNPKNRRIFCKTCNREGKCTSCTDLKHHGDNCTGKCEECGLEGCNIKGYCKEFKCPNASYGLGCETKCKCGKNSNDETCGKFRGQCSSCKFGYFGEQCKDNCNYKCQTELCCLFKNKTNNNMTKLKVTTSYKTIQIKIKEKLYIFEIDYNYGFPLTIFNNQTELINCNNYYIEKTEYENVTRGEEFQERFTNYNISSYLISNETIIINGNLSIKTDIAIAHRVKCLSKEEIKEKVNGVIGLGFFNSISNAIFTNNSNSSWDNYTLNILSFNYIAEGDQIEMLFGDLFEEQRDYVERLTSCKVILDGKSDIQEKKMTCQLDGIKVSKYSEAFKLNNSFITFSLGEKSSLILGNNSNYLDYLKRAFFNNESLDLIDDPDNGGIQYILYPNDKINKLSDIGLVFNYYSYSYPPNTFFVNTTNGAEGKSQFLIKINKNSDRTEFIIGKEFFSDIKFTINNEEAQIYFYAQNAQYCDKFTDVITDSLFNIKLGAQETSAICLSIIVFIYLAAFTIYFFVKRKKMKSGDYIRIE